MFWTKIGTSTGAAESGTVEEIDQFVAEGKPALLYFSSRPIDPNKIDLKQHKKLRAFSRRGRTAGDQPARGINTCLLQIRCCLPAPTHMFRLIFFNARHDCIALKPCLSQLINAGFPKQGHDDDRPSRIFSLLFAESETNS